ncbi:MAG TPA: hypothetical protein VNA57_10280 [Acidimicrobiales bacterium]|nr:hypothetical protein [Acidimicrobiales bacterium]
MELNEHDPITRRLHALGDQPIDPEVMASHRSLMASVPVAAGRSRLRPLMAGSLLAGSLLGGMGLAAAAPGVPDAASEVAKTVLATVTLGAVDHPDHDKDKDEEAKVAEVDEDEQTPEAKAAAQAAKTAAQAAKAERKAAKAAGQPAGTHGVTRSTVGCPAGFTGNHGQYVSSVAKTPGVTEEQKTAAAQSECGKPVHAPKPAGEDNANKPATAGKSGEEHGEQGKAKSSEDPGTAVNNGQSGQSGADHRGNHPNRRAFDKVAKHGKADAGRSAGHGPTTTTVTE